MVSEDALGLLDDVELFDRFDSEDRRRLSDAAELVQLVRGDVVFEEGAEADACFVMVSGRVAISNHRSSRMIEMPPN